MHSGKVTARRLTIPQGFRATHSRYWIAVLAVAGALQSSVAGAAELIEAQGFTCLSMPDGGDHSESLLMFGAMSAARTVRIVRAPILARVEPTRWCPGLPPSGLVGEALEAKRAPGAEVAEPDGPCRLDGPPLRAGVLGFTVVETLQGKAAPNIEVRLDPRAKGAFSDQFHPQDPEASCDQGSVLGDIGGNPYWSPMVFALNPMREFLLVEARGDDGMVLIVAVSLPAKSDKFKRALRAAARKGAKKPR